MEVTVNLETWPLKKPFAIAGVTQTQATCLHVALSYAGVTGHGESEPHICDADIQQRLAAQVRAVADALHPHLRCEDLRDLLPAAAARNAVDCALWDWRAKRQRVPAGVLAGLPAPRSLNTAMTLGLDSPMRLHSHAVALRRCGLIKIKLDGNDDVARVEAVRRAAPRSQLIVDANGAWSLHQLREQAPRLAALGVRLIEQPLPPHADEALARYRSPVPLCADESCTDAVSLARLTRRYRVVNLKLDKVGGFTEALQFAREARRRGLRLMTGCNVGTSLAMAPAWLLGTMSEFVDIDGASLLRSDRAAGLDYDLARGRVAPPRAELWG